MEPERPHDQFEMWDIRCEKCIMRINLLAQKEDSDKPVFGFGTREVIGTFGDLVAHLGDPRKRREQE